VTARPGLLVVVLGTATGVGKTWTAAVVARELRASGATVAARKPVQSHEPGAGSLDAAVLARATGEDPGDVCPPHRSYPLAMAPPMAADALGQPPFTVADLVGELRWSPDVAVGLVETVGGPRSPVAADGDSVGLAAALAPDLVVLVADAGLGAINAVRLSAAACAGVAAPLVVAVNRFDPADDLHHRTRDWLVADGLDLAVSPRELAGRLQPSVGGGAEVEAPDDATAATRRDAAPR